MQGLGVAKSKIWRLAEEKGSRILIALDVLRMEPMRLVEEVQSYIVGVKVGLPFILQWGLDEVRELIDVFSSSLYILCDFKLADIPEIVAEELRLIWQLGFDGAILHLFQGGVEKLASLPHRPELFGLVSMTHEESRLIDQHFEDLVSAVKEAGFEGCIVPATKPNLIAEARRRLPHSTLISPGVGTQGARVGSAVSAGSDFEIIGRAITTSSNPKEAAKAARDAINRALSARALNSA